MLDTDASEYQLGANLLKQQEDPRRALRSLVGQGLFLTRNDAIQTPKGNSSRLSGPYSQ